MRYFLEVSYKGTAYAGFQVQSNAPTIQGEVQRALATVFREPVELTGSSRTDAGVHALQNFFHFDYEKNCDPAIIYNLNALLPRDIVIKSLFAVRADVHARFAAQAREYRYYITNVKDPFSNDTAWYYPYYIDLNLLQQAAETVRQHTDFTSFSKRNSQVKNYHCTIISSQWILHENSLVYHVKANRFLRGMVRGLVGTMLLVGRKRITLADFEAVIQSKDCTKANFSTPPQGLFLVKVEYPQISV